MVAYSSFVGRRDYSHCDYNAVPDTTKLKSLTNNQFHKICPAVVSNTKFGDPQCGDGTPFSFYFSRPMRKFDNEEKILIEFQGGGACWNANTCDRMSERLTFPTMYDSLLGYSCSEANFVVNEFDGFPISMLCGKHPSETGDKVDLREYNTVVIPYCTQDVHLGDSIMDYDGDGENSVRHKGASNVISSLSWVFSNFRNPSHIILTGCSAGGTVLPVAYDLIGAHYYHGFRGGPRPLQISVLVDSAVYLTPQYFLENSFDNWKPWNILKKVGFNYNKYKLNENFSSLLWEHILKRGSRYDRWGFLTHTEDPISTYYFEAMGGYEDDDYGNDDGDQWWTLLSTSLQTLKNAHKNFDIFMIDGEGHCSFGLYYGFAVEGFGEWAGSLFKESTLIGKHRNSVILFCVACVLGGCSAFVLLKKYDGRVSVEVDKNDLIENESDSTNQSNYRAKMKNMIPQSFLKYISMCPFTSGYMIMVTFYFWSMIFGHGFAHLLDNPSFGPTPQVLSSYGINNPTLIVYHLEIWRLFSSTFLCSGLFTYLLTMFCCWKHIRYIEERIDSSKAFSVLCLTLCFGPSLIYACTRDGASCGTLAFVLGLNAYSITSVALNTDEGREKCPIFFPNPWIATMIVTILACVIFPFNNWVYIFSSISIGIVMARLTVIGDGVGGGLKTMVSQTLISRRALLITISIYTAMLFILVFRGRRPDKMYEYPFFTGCNLLFTDKVSDIVGSFMNDDEADNRRHLGSGDVAYDQDMCAQACVPHIASMGTVWGVEQYFDVSLENGVCDEEGSYYFMFAKTFKYFTYSLDVEVFGFNGDDAE